MFLSETFNKFQPTVVVAAHSMNAEYLLTRKRLQLALTFLVAHTFLLYRLSSTGDFDNCLGFYTRHPISSTVEKLIVGLITANKKAIAYFISYLIRHVLFYFNFCFHSLFCFQSIVRFALILIKEISEPIKI